MVGPPGTGKTDVAVQIISNLYHNFPDQRTLIVTHSNQVCPVLCGLLVLCVVDREWTFQYHPASIRTPVDADFHMINSFQPFTLECLARFLPAEPAQVCARGMLGGTMPADHSSFSYAVYTLSPILMHR